MTALKPRWRFISPEASRREHGLGPNASVFLRWCSSARPPASQNSRLSNRIVFLGIAVVKSFTRGGITHSSRIHRRFIADSSLIHRWFIAMNLAKNLIFPTKNQHSSLDSSPDSSPDSSLVHRLIRRCFRFFLVVAPQNLSGSKISIHFIAFPEP